MPLVVSNDNIFLTRGDDASFTVFRTGFPFQAGDTVYFTVKTSLLTKDITLQKEITEFVDGKAIVNIDHEDTKDLSYGYYFYDVQLTNALIKRTTIMGPGSFVLKEEVNFD